MFPSCSINLTNMEARSTMNRQRSAPSFVTEKAGYQSLNWIRQMFSASNWRKKLKKIHNGITQTILVKMLLVQSK